MVIPTVAAVAVKHFRSKQGDSAHMEPKHPAVAFLLDAWNSGDFSRVDKLVPTDISIHTNGRPLAADRDGQSAVCDSIQSWRALAPDLVMELREEIRNKRRIAIEFRITGTLAADGSRRGGPIEVSGSAFLSINKGEVTEVRTVYDTLTVALANGSVSEWTPPPN